MVRILLFLLLLFNQNMSAQKLIDISRLKSNFAKSENKQKYYGNLEKNIDLVFSGTFNGNWAEWNKALKDVQAINYSSKLLLSALKKVLASEVDKYIKLQRTALEVAYGIDNKEVKTRIKAILTKSNDPVSVAISAKYLSKIEKEFDIQKILEKKSVKIKNSNIISELIKDLLNENFILPDLSVLLNHDFQKGKTVIFSFHRKNRKFPGITLIRKPDGSFAKNPDGTFFHIKQLALSYSNLPYYIPNGNTPQGIYSVVGQYISPTETIGPTPNVLTRIPFEVSPGVFFHENNKYSKWNMKDYVILLPEAWKNYAPVYEAYYAGKLGRKLIIIHGSTDETKYFNNEPYYPLTPTRGCLSSYELWDEKRGKCVESEQLLLINKLREIKQLKGFLVVLELDNQQKPVKIEEIEHYLK